MLIKVRKDNSEYLFVNRRIIVKCVHFVIAQPHKTLQYNELNQLKYLFKKYYTNMSFGAMCTRNTIQDRLWATEHPADLNWITINAHLI